jgi:hypothetical protein
VGLPTGSGATQKDEGHEHGRGGAIIDAVKPVPGESVVVKPSNVFAQTELDATLKRLGRAELVISGFMTHMCVSSTVRAALELAFCSLSHTGATVAADAAATRDLPDPLGGVLAADALHRAAIAELADRFAVVATVADCRETALRSAQHLGKFDSIFAAPCLRAHFCNWPSRGRTWMVVSGSIWTHVLRASSSTEPAPS